MRLLGWMTGCLGLSLLVIGCGQSPSAQRPPSEAENASEAIASIDGIGDQTSPETVTDPFNPSGRETLQPIPPPPLLPPTTATQRLPQLEPGRGDPFAPLVANPTLTRSSSASPSPAVAPALPTVPVASAPSIPPAPFATTPIPVQPPAVPTAPSASPPSSPAPAAVAPTAPPAPVQVPVSLAHAIEVSGVVQVGGRTNVIIRIPNETTSRYVSIGDTLANGRIRVKRVDMTSGADPIVVLEQDGVEIVRSVGSAAQVSMSAL